jgi:hypothetical protein
MSCISRNLIYILLCNGCQEIYVGETGDLLRTRINYTGIIFHIVKMLLYVSAAISMHAGGGKIYSTNSLFSQFLKSPLMSTTQILGKKKKIILSSY